MITARSFDLSSATRWWRARDARNDARTRRSLSPRRAVRVVRVVAATAAAASAAAPMEVAVLMAAPPAVAPAVLAPVSDIAAGSAAIPAAVRPARVRLATLATWAVTRTSAWPSRYRPKALGGGRCVP